MTPRTWWRAPLLALLAVMLLAFPAGAHPFVRGTEVPVDSLATITLAMAHGCGTEDDAGGDPTEEVALEVPEWLDVVSVADTDGYESTLEETDDGRVEAVVWTATEAGEPAPEFDLDVVATGEPGEERYLRVSQGCEGFTYRWIGTPDDPADDPAVRILLVEADPDSPPPPDAAPEAGPEGDADAPPTDEELDEDPQEDVGDEVLDEDTVEDDAAAPDVEDEADGADAAAGDDGGTPWWVPVLAAAVVLLALVPVLRRRGRGAPDPDDPSDPRDTSGPADGSTQAQ